MEQQGTDTYSIKPVQRYDRSWLDHELDGHIRTRYNLWTLGPRMPPPANFMGRKNFRAPPPEARSWNPGTLSGVYKYEGPVLEAYGIVPKFQL